MKPLHLLPALVLFASLSACGPSTPAQAPEAPKEAASAEPVASASAAPTAAPEAPKPPPAETTSPSQALARDLIKSGGRRIGYSASKKRFVAPIETLKDNSRGLDLRFFDEDGAQRENLRVCQVGECEVKLDEVAKELIPKLAERLEKEGYEAVYSVGWPQGREELDVSSVGLKLRYEKGRLLSIVEKKPPRPLRAGGRGPKAASLLALYPVPAAKLIGVFAPGDGVVQEFFVYKY